MYLRRFALRRIAARHLFDATQEPAQALTAALIAEATRDGRSKHYPAAYDLHGLSPRGVLTWERMEQVAASAAASALAYHDPARVERWREDGRRGGLKSAETRAKNMKAPLPEVAALMAQGWTRQAMADHFGVLPDLIKVRVRALKAQQASAADVAAAGVPNRPAGTSAVPGPQAPLPQPQEPAGAEHEQHDIEHAQPGTGEGRLRSSNSDPLAEWRRADLEFFTADL